MTRDVLTCTCAWCTRYIGAVTGYSSIENNFDGTVDVQGRSGAGAGMADQTVNAVAVRRTGGMLFMGAGPSRRLVHVTAAAVESATAPDRQRTGKRAFAVAVAVGVRTGTVLCPRGVEVVGVNFCPPGIGPPGFWSIGKADTKRSFAGTGRM